MMTAFAITCFVVAAFAFTYGAVTAYRQTRSTGPIAIVPTLPFAVQAAVLVVLGLYLLSGSRPWWSYPLRKSGIRTMTKQRVLYESVMRLGHRAKLPNTQCGGARPTEDSITPNISGRAR